MALHKYVLAAYERLITIQLSWIAACDVLIREAQKPQSERADVRITDVHGTTREKIDWLLAGLKTVSQVYPGSYRTFYYP